MTGNVPAGPILGTYTVADLDEVEQPGADLVAWVGRSPSGRTMLLADHIGIDPDRVVTVTAVSMGVHRSELLVPEAGLADTIDVLWQVVDPVAVVLQDVRDTAQELRDRLVDQLHQSYGRPPELPTAPRYAIQDALRRIGPDLGLAVGLAARLADDVELGTQEYGGTSRGGRGRLPPTSGAGSGGGVGPPADPGGGVGAPADPGGGVPMPADPGGGVPMPADPGGGVPLPADPGGGVGTPADPGGGYAVTGRTHRWLEDGPGDGGRVPRDGDDPGEPVERYVVAELDTTVAVGEIAWLLISLVAETTAESSVPVTLVPGSVVEVLVRPVAGVEVVGEDRGRLTVDRHPGSLPLRFQLRGTAAGPASVQVLVFHRTQTLGVLTLEPVVLPAGIARSTGRSDRRQPLAPVSVRLPDLAMLVFERAVQGGTEYTIRLAAHDPALQLNYRAYGPMVLRRDPTEVLAGFFDELGGLSLRTTAERQIAEALVAARGRLLLTDLVPADLQQTLWDLRERITSVFVQSEEPWIPWELVRLRDPATGQEGDPLCIAYEMTRWKQGLAFSPVLDLARLAVVAPAAPDLTAAAPERDAVLRLAGAELLDPSFLRVTAALEQRAYGGFHFIGHGEAGASADQARLLLRDHPLTPRDLPGPRPGSPRPLVVLNACDSGRSELALTGVGGWAQRLLDWGAGAFIGTYWAVFDASAAVFSETLYANLLAPEPVPFGAAVRAARLAARRLGDPSWLAYTAWADPNATVPPAPIHSGG